MGSFVRNALPVGLALAFGVFNGTHCSTWFAESIANKEQGYYVFNATLKEQQEERLKNAAMEEQETQESRKTQDSQKTQGSQKTQDSQSGQLPQQPASKSDST